MLSHLEIRHLMESAFLPLECKCEIDPEGSMTIQLVNARTKEVGMTASGIRASGLTSSRALAALVSELKGEYNVRPTGQLDRRQHRR